jgi:hypothetical protein
LVLSVLFDASRQRVASSRCCVATLSLYLSRPFEGGGAKPTLTLACEGTASNATKTNAKPDLISAGIIIDFTDRTVKGFPFLSSAPDIAIKITHVTETTIQLRGEGETAAAFIGVIDRVTGDLTAVSFQTSHFFHLKCKPTQRMF